MKPSKETRLRSASGASLTHLGQKEVRFRCGGREVVVTFEVVSVVRPILSVSRLVEQGFAIAEEAGEARLQRKESDGNTVSVPRLQRAGLYFLPVDRPHRGWAAPVAAPESIDIEPVVERHEQAQEPAYDLEMEGAVNGPVVEAPAGRAIG